MADTVEIDVEREAFAKARDDPLIVLHALVVGNQPEPCRMRMTEPVAFDANPAAVHCPGQPRRGSRIQALGTCDDDNAAVGFGKKSPRCNRAAGCQGCGDIEPTQHTVVIGMHRQPPQRCLARQHIPHNRLPAVTENTGAGTHDDATEACRIDGQDAGRKQRVGPGRIGVAPAPDPEAGNAIEGQATIRRHPATLSSLGE